MSATYNLADLWESVVDAVPDKESLVCGTRRLTFAQVDERANRLAHALAARGVGAGDHIGLYLYNCTEYLEAMIAAFKIRAVPVNVNYRYVEGELRYLLDNAEAKAVLLHRELAPRLSTVQPDLPDLRTAIWVDDESNAEIAMEGAVEYERALAAESPDRDFGPRSADDLYILYTGGTTGMPKGVMWRHEDIFFAAFGGGGMGDHISVPEEIVERARAGVIRCLPACPFMHGTAHWLAFGALYMGGTVIIDDRRHLDPVHVWQLVASEHVNFLVFVGDAMGRPLAEAIDHLDPSFDRTATFVMVSGGAILSPSVKRDLTTRLPNAIVIDGIGASETGSQGQMVVSKDGEIPSQPRFAMTDDNAVLDDDLHPVGVGVVGKLARRGHIPLGYFKDPEKSSGTFPVVDGVRWSVPGDHARIEEDGTITVLGRGSVSINTGGEKVYPEEVEGVLKSHPDIFDAVVVGVPDARWGERVVAVVQTRDDTHVSIDAVGAHARTLLAGYKVPRDVVEVDKIVRSPSGKPDYRWAKETAIGFLQGSE